MTEIEIDKRDLERLIETLDASPSVLRQARRKAFEVSAPKLRALLDQGFAQVGLHERTGTVLSWQEQYIGSGGGYTAVRPRAKTFTETNGKGKRYAVGQVTNAIESGHKFPTPSGTSRRYKPRIRSSALKVRPYAFYAAARVNVPALARETADQILQALIDHVEG